MLASYQKYSSSSSNSKNNKKQHQYHQDSFSFPERMLRSIVLSIRIRKNMIMNVGKWLVVFIVIGQLVSITTGIPFLFSKRNFGKNANKNLPSSLTSDPTLALVKPGNCQFTKKYTDVPLLKKWKISPTTSVLRFGLPNSDEPLNLSTCACILAKADVMVSGDDENDSESVIRPYTPISTNAQIGSFDLLVKDYPTGKLSHHLCSSLKVGDTMSFSHIPFNNKIQAPFVGKKRIGMIAGGTGITPMIQALHAILGDDESEEEVEVTLLYGSKTSSEILGKELLDAWSTKYYKKFTVIHVLSQEHNPNWKGHTGHIDESMITKYLPPPTPDGDSILIFVCGPDSMYDSISGPRGTKSIEGGILQKMGYTQEQVYKF